MVCDVDHPQGDAPRLQHLLAPLFLSRFLPRIAVIQCGADNPYGHPTLETFGRLQRTGDEVFRNGEHGDVIVTIKNEKVDATVTKPAVAF